MRSSHAILLLSMMLISIVCPSTVSAADAVTLTAHAEQLIQEGNYEEAKSVLKTVIGDYPAHEKTWHARVKLSECFLRQKKYDECILEARKIVNSYPSAAPQVQATWAQFNIGLACLEKKDVEAAKWELSQVEEITGQNPDRGAWIQARNKLALIYHGANNRNMAAKIASEVIADSSVAGNDKAWAEVILGYSLVGNRRVEEGLEKLYKARDNYQQFQEPLLAADKKICDVNLGKHDYDLVTAECRALLADPNVSEARAKQAGDFLLRTLQYNKEYDKVLVETQILLDRFNYSPDEQRPLLDRKARMLAMTKQYAEAIEGFKAILASNPTDPEFCAQLEWNLALCYQMSGQHSLANETFARIAELYPTSCLSDRAADKLQVLQ